MSPGRLQNAVDGFLQCAMECMASSELVAKLSGWWERDRQQSTERSGEIVGNVDYLHVATRFREASAQL